MITHVKALVHETFSPIGDAWAKNVLKKLADLRWLGPNVCSKMGFCENSTANAKMNC